MATFTPAKRATAYIVYVGLVSQANTKILRVNPTIASGDFKVSIDGGALANLATLPTVTPAAGALVKISLSAAEMTGDNITVHCLDAAGAEWCDLLLNIQTAARQIDDLAYPATSGRSMVVDAAGLVDANTVKLGPTGTGTAQTARDVGGNVDVAVSTRMATYVQPTGFLAATFPAGTVANTTNITAGTITTTTNLTNLPTIPANWLTAAGTAADFGAEIATAFWTDTTATDFTVALSVGKSVMNGVALGTGLTINAYTGDTPQTGDSFARIGLAGVGLSNIGTIATVTNLTNLPTIPANWITTAGITDGAFTAAKFAAGSLNGKGDWLLSSGYTAPLSAAATATAVWTDITATDFTVALSVGKSVMNGVALGTGLTINAYTGDTPQTGDSFARIGVAGAGLTNIDLPNQTMDIIGNLSGSVGSVTTVNGLAANVITAASIATDAIDSDALSASAVTEIVDAVWAKALEPGFTADKLMRIVAASVAGKVSGGAASPVFRNVGDTLNQITGVADSSGNRTTATYGA